MQRNYKYALVGALVLGLASVANAAVTGSGMHGASQMQTMSGGMMSMMMGDDPVAACSSMMKKVAANPKLHREMNAIMKSQMGSSSGITTSKPRAQPQS